MALRLKRGSTADRLQLYFEQGELVYDLDLEQVFVGNGLQSEGGTIGGVAVGSGSGGSLVGIVDNTTGPVITLNDVQSTFTNDIYLDTGTILTGLGDIDIAGSITTEDDVSARNITAASTIFTVNLNATGDINGDVTGNLRGDILNNDFTVAYDHSLKESFISKFDVPTIFHRNTDNTPTEYKLLSADFSAIKLNKTRTDIDLLVDTASPIGSIFYEVEDINGFASPIIINGYSNRILFAVRDAEGGYSAAAFTGDSRFGIGTETPAEALDVRGSAVIRDRLVANEISGNIVADDSTLIFDSATGKIPYTALANGTASIGDVLKFDGNGWIASPDLQGTGGGAASVSAATQANPIVITTSAAHNFGDGQKVTFTDIVGMIELNGNSYFVDVLTIDTFALYSDAALTTPVDGTAFTAYVSGGSAAPAPATDAVTLDGQFASYYLDYNNFTNTPTIPTLVSQLTNDSGFITSEANDLTANVTWANIPDANVPQSAVTQHQAALTITESQISDLQSYLTAADLGAFTLTGSVLDTSDSSTITITPAVTIQSDLNVENNLVVTNKITVDTLEVNNLITAGAGTPELQSDTEILLTAGTRVEVTQSPFRLASLSTAQRDALTAQNGDMIYNTTLNKFQGYQNGSWINLDGTV